MAKYVLGDKEVSEEEFYKEMFKSESFFLDEVISNSFPANKDKTEEKLLEELQNRLVEAKDYIGIEDATLTFTMTPKQVKKALTTTVDMSKAKGENIFSNVIWNSEELSVKEAEKVRKTFSNHQEKYELNKVKDGLINSQKFKPTEVVNILNSESEEDLGTILKRNMSIGEPDYETNLLPGKGVSMTQTSPNNYIFSWEANQTGGTVFEKLQNINIPKSACINPCNSFDVGELKSVYRYLEKESVDNFTSTLQDIGKKETAGKLFYELDFQFIKQMAERMQSNKDNSKYKKWNWKQPLSDDNLENLKQAMWRHILAVMDGEYEDDGRPYGHLEAISNNAMMINYQLKNK